MQNFRQVFASALSMVCLASAGSASEPQGVSPSSSAPSGAGILATVRVEFRAADRAVVSIAPGLYDSSEPAERREAVAIWRSGEGRLLVTYDGETDRLEAVLQSGADATVVVHGGAVPRGFDKLDPLRYAPSVMGLLAETANRGAAGAIELRAVEVGAGRRPRSLQEIGAGAQAVSQLLHADRTLAHGFSLAGTIRLTGARPSAESPLTVEVRLLADQVDGPLQGTGFAAPENSGGTFTNSTPTTIPPLGTATPYPSQITIVPDYYLTGVVTSVVVGFDNFDHTYPGEIAALLVGPAGDAVELMHFTCGDFDLLDADFTFDDAAVLHMPNAAPCYSGSWKPSGHGPSNPYPPPAPPPPGYWHEFTPFLGDSPIGTWNLYIDTHEDFALIDLGRLDAWSLTLTTAIQIPGSGTFGNAAPYPSTYSFSGNDPSLGLKDCLVTISGLTHTYLSDIHLLFLVPSGQTAYLVGDACPGTNAVNLDWVFNDFAAGFLPGSPCATGTYRPTVLGFHAFPGARTCSSLRPCTRRNQRQRCQRRLRALCAGRFQQ